MTAPVFVTARLLVRRLAAHDVDDLLAVYGDADAMRWVGDGQPLARAGCVEWVAVTQRNYAQRGYGMFAVALRDSGDPVGFGGLVHPGGQPEAEVKYAVRRSAWGQGYATELVRGLLDYARDHAGLTRVIATVAPANVVSQRVLARAGLVPAEPRIEDDGSTTLVYAWTVAAPRS